MPIAKHNGKAIYYAHVPKCAGSSVEDYLTERFGELAFLDRAFYADGKWSKSSPQHIDLQALQEIFPKDWFDHSFAVVRNPFTRFVSAWNFSCVNNRHAFARTWKPETFLQSVFVTNREYGWQHDNHFTTQSNLVPSGATIFKMEDGLDRIVAYLDAITNSVFTRSGIGKSNVTKQAVKNLKKVPLSSEAIELIATTYKDDFTRFGYSKDVPDGLTVFQSTRPPSLRRQPKMIYHWYKSWTSHRNKTSHDVDRVIEP